MGKIDTAGVYVGTIKESGVSLTKKGFPQWVARLVASQKWIDTPADIEHFKLTEPGYVDWSSFNEEIVAFQVLFNNAEEFSKDTALLNYEQLKTATGWDGTEFDTLSDGTFVGKSLQFRIAEDTYDGKTSLKVNWIDSADAPAERQLKSLAGDEIKALSKKLKFAAPKPAAVAAKPAAKPAPKAAPTPAAAPVVEAAPVTPAAVPAAPPKTTKKKTASAPAVEKPGTPPKETTQGEAWEYVTTHKGDNEDSVIEEAWIAACGEVGENKDEDQFTGADWAKVRDIALKDLDIKVAEAA